MPEDIIGPLVAQADIESAVIGTYRDWLPFYLAEVERKHDLPAQSLPRLQSDEALHGGLDFLTWRQDLNPEVIVVVEPTGEPERSVSEGYTQAYEVQVGVMWVGSYGSQLAEEAEDEARIIAGYYGAALMLLVHQGDLQGLAGEETIMVSAPRLTLPFPNRREICQATAAFHAFVGPIIDQNAGVSADKPSESPLYGGSPEAPFQPPPEVIKTNLAVKAEVIP